MAAAFVAMNSVFGKLFDVSEAEAADPAQGAERAKALQKGYIFDDQTHFVHDKFHQEGILGLAVFAAEHWNKALTDKEKSDLYYYKFENYVRQIFFNSDTSVALLSGAPFDDKSWVFLSNEQIREGVDIVNHIASGRRMLGHALVTPGQPGWMEEVDQSIEQLRPDELEDVHHWRPAVGENQVPLAS